MTSKYELTCTDCSFERTVEGVDRALDVADAHRACAAGRHFVELYLCEEAFSDTESGASSGPS
jgi:hypothetical protein